MIKYRIEEKKQEISIEIKGHAGYSKKGQDIVCASVSTLFFLFLNYLTSIDESSIKHLQVKDGDVELSFKLNIRTKKIKPLLKEIVAMLEELMCQYPQCITEEKND